MQIFYCEKVQAKKLQYIICGKHFNLLPYTVYDMSEIARFITESSFSAVGLFFGFLVRDSLTKLWKAVDLGKEIIFF